MSAKINSIEITLNEGLSDSEREDVLNAVWMMKNILIARFGVEDSSKFVAEQRAKNEILHSVYALAKNEG